MLRPSSLFIATFQPSLTGKVGDDTQQRAWAGFKPRSLRYGLSLDVVHTLPGELPGLP